MLTSRTKTSELSWFDCVRLWSAAWHRKRAHRIFNEALRCSYHDPKIWENYLLVCACVCVCVCVCECTGGVQVSAELKLWSDCLRAYHMLCQLDSKFLDVEILGLLVGACAEEERSAAPPPGGWRGGLAVCVCMCVCAARESVGQLLGRIAARGKVAAQVWKLYANFHFSSSLREDHVKVCTCALSAEGIQL